MRSWWMKLRKRKKEGEGDGIRPAYLNELAGERKCRLPKGFL